MRFRIFLWQRRAHPPTFSSPAHDLPRPSPHVGTRGRLVPSCACPMHARENARENSFECASGRRSGRAFRESARGPEEKRAAGEGEKGACAAGGGGERGGGGRSWPSWERLVRALVKREREKSRTRLVPRDGSWLLVADARRVAPASPSSRGSGSRYRRQGEWVPDFKVIANVRAVWPRRAFKWKCKVNAPIKAAIDESLCVRITGWRKLIEICFMLKEPYGWATKGFNVRILFLVRDTRENLYTIRCGIENSFQNWSSENFLIYLLQRRNCTN